MKRKLLFLPLILGAIVAFFSAWVSWETGDIGITGFNTAVGLANLISISFIEKKMLVINVLLNLLNVAVALLTAYLFMEAGKKGLAGVYIFAAAGFSFATIRYGIEVYKKQGLKI